MFSFKSKKATKEPQKPGDLNADRNHAETLAKKILGVYLSMSLVNDQEQVSPYLKDSIDRAVLAAVEVDKEYKLGLF